jgi:hypothetical protein
MREAADPRIPPHHCANRSDTGGQFEGLRDKRAQIRARKYRWPDVPTPCARLERQFSAPIELPPDRMDTQPLSGLLGLRGLAHDPVASVSDR